MLAPMLTSPPSLTLGLVTSHGGSGSGRWSLLSSGWQGQAPAPALISQSGPSISSLDQWERVLSVVRDWAQPRGPGRPDSLTSSVFLISQKSSSVWSDHNSTSCLSQFTEGHVWTQCSGWGLGPKFALSAVAVVRANSPGWGWRVECGHSWQALGREETPRSQLASVAPPGHPPGHHHPMLLGEQSVLGKHPRLVFAVDKT